MVAVILAGGTAKKIGADFETVPKPMIEIGDMPVLWHVMKLYSYYGINDFVICLGEKGYVVKEFFANYSLHHSDVTFDYEKNSTTVHNNTSEPWKVTLVDTGKDTATAGRLKRVSKYIGNETFCLSYGDTLSDVDLKNLIQFHKSEKEKGVITTMTAVSPQSRRGALVLEKSKVASFGEPILASETYMNGGFFVAEPEVLDYINGDDSYWESDVLIRLQNEGSLAAYRHNGQWSELDTLRDKINLDELWQNNKAFWKKWQVSK